MYRNQNKWKSNDRRSKVKRIKVRDRVIANEKSSLGGFEGEVIFGRGRHVITYTDPYGRPAYRSVFEEELDKNHNIVPIGGYQFAFDKLFNIAPDQETTLRIGDLNDEAPQMKIGVPRSEYQSIYYNAECSIDHAELMKIPGVNISALNYIQGFMMGEGGSREDNTTAIAPHYTDRSLYRPVPFRMSNDGYPLEEGKYLGNTEFQLSSGEIVTSSYIKKFDDPAPHIVHVWATENKNDFQVVDDSVFSSTSSMDIESYVEINFSVNIYDGRGYFAMMDSKPRVNEFGLVSYWLNPITQMGESIRLFSHFTRPSISLTDGDSIEGIYRIYAR